MNILVVSNNKKIGIKLKELRNCLLLTYQDIEDATSVSRVTIKRIEEGKGGNIKNIGLLIFFFGYEYDEFFNFVKPIPGELALKDRITKFHKKHKSNSCEKIYKQPDLIELVEHKILKTTKLFDTWIEASDVDRFVEENYGYTYENTSGTLLTAVKNDLLISKRKFDNDKARLNLYRKK